MSELFLLGSLVITTVGTLVGYFIGRSEAKAEYTKINNRNLRAMNELENEVEELAAKLNPIAPVGNVAHGWTAKITTHGGGGGGSAPVDARILDEPASNEPKGDYAKWHSENISDPQPPAAPPKKAKASEKKKQTPKRKKGKK